MIDKLTGKDGDSDKIGMLINSEASEFYPYYKELKEIKEMSGIQARMPYVLDIY